MPICGTLHQQGLAAVKQSRTSIIVPPAACPSVFLDGVMPAVELTGVRETRKHESFPRAVHSYAWAIIFRVLLGLFCKLVRATCLIYGISFSVRWCVSNYSAQWLWTLVPGTW